MINLTLPETDNQMRPRIVVFGVGGAGSNAINNMIRLGLDGIDFIAANTDAQALAGNLAPQKLQLGVTVTRGLGAGARPDVGREAAEEQLDEINAVLDGAHMAFITAGMGGGTGTGAGPVIARAARERGILTVGVVTKPFQFEGAVRMRSAEAGIQALQQFVDTLIVIPNQNLFNIANEKTTFADAFKMADDVLYQGVRGVTDLIMTPGQINLDFADIRSVMSEMGKAMMGTGEAEGDNRARQAAEMAINNPLLDDASVKGARGVLINITGGTDLTLFEVEEAADRIRDEVDPDANIIFGTALDESMNGKIRISVVATGIDLQAGRQRPPLEVVGGSSATSGAQGGMGGLPTAWPAQTTAAGSAAGTGFAAQRSGGATGSLASSAQATAFQGQQAHNQAQFQAQMQQAQVSAQQAHAVAQAAASAQHVAAAAGGGFTPTARSTGASPMPAPGAGGASPSYPTGFYSGLTPEQQGNTLRVSQPQFPAQTVSHAAPPATAGLQQAQQAARARAEAASAPLRGGRQGDQFVAPAPAQAPRMAQPVPVSQPLPPHAPSSHAPVQSASARKPGLGQRMLGKMKQLVNAIDTAETGAVAPAAPSAPPAAYTGAPMSSPSPYTHPQAPMAQAPRSDYQVTQGGRAGLPPVEDADIDIPAFLRRQAN